jgi:hypothetical protein
MDCTFSSNSATYGGGSYEDTLTRCTFSGNSADKGGGSYLSTLTDCMLTNNLATGYGGGSYEGTLTGCTLANNAAYVDGGGSYDGTLINCIIWNNTADGVSDNWFASSPDFAYCCTTPLPGGTGNSSDDPLFADGLAGHYRLLPQSPCLNAGYNDSVTTETDLDGNARISDGTVDLGAYEGATLSYLLITSTTLQVAIEVDTYDLAGISSDLSGTMVWSNAANQATGSQTAGTTWQISDIPLAPGENQISVQSTNAQRQSFGDWITVVRNPVDAGDSPIHYVSLSGTAEWPYTNWVTAATCLQNAVDAAVDGDTILVAAGTYKLDDQVVVTNAVCLQSVAGAEYTLLDGQQKNRVLYLGQEVTVDGFTVTNGYSQGYGGGVHCENESTLTHCIIANNSAVIAGGGSYLGTLSDCTLSGN